MLPPEEIRAKNQDQEYGPGARTLTEFEQYIILRLCIENPSMHLNTYRDWVYSTTGTVVSVDTIRRLLHDGFPYKGTLVRPKLVPMDKFKPENEIRAYDYLSFLLSI